MVIICVMYHAVRNFLFQGCSLHDREKRSKHFHSDVVLFLKELYFKGVQDIGQKAKASEVEVDMRRVRNAAGQFRFHPNQWLTENQIKNYFSSLTAKLKKQQDKEGSSKAAKLLSPSKRKKVSLDDIELSDEELEDEIALNEAQENAMDKLKIKDSLDMADDSLSECPIKVPTNEKLLRMHFHESYVCNFFLIPGQ